MNVKYWRDVLLRDQRSERTQDWGDREREMEGEMMINFVNAVTGQVLAVNSALGIRTEGCILAWRCMLKVLHFFLG